MHEKESIKQIDVPVHRSAPAGRFGNFHRAVVVVVVVVVVVAVVVVAVAVGVVDFVVVGVRPGGHPSNPASRCRIHRRRSWACAAGTVERDKKKNKRKKKEKKRNEAVVSFIRSFRIVRNTGGRVAMATHGNNGSHNGGNHSNRIEGTWAYSSPVFACSR